MQGAFQTEKMVRAKALGGGVYEAVCVTVSQVLRQVEGVLREGLKCGTEEVAGALKTGVGSRLSPWWLGKASLGVLGMD